MAQPVCRLIGLFLTFMLWTSPLALGAGAGAEEIITNAELETRGLRIVQPTARSGIERSGRARDVLDTRVAAGASAATAAGTLASGLRLSVGEYQQVERIAGNQSLTCSQSGNSQCLRSSVGYLLKVRSGQLLDLALDLEAPAALRYVTGLGLFTATFFVKLTDTASPNATGIPEPIQIAIVSNADHVQPEGGLLEIQRTNHFVPVTVSTAHPSDPFAVNVTASNRASAAKLSFGVNRPQLRLSLPTRMLGFGLEEVPVEIRLANTGTPPTRAIDLTADTGTLTQTSLTFDANGRASTTLRSEGMGIDRVSASLTPFEPAEEKIRYEFPTSWLTAMCVGAVLGFFALRHKWSYSTGNWFKDLLYALAAGTLGALLVALGINLTGFSLPSGFSEALVAVVSAISGIALPALIAGRAGPAPD